MDALEFDCEVLAPTLAEFEANPDNLRLAYLTILSVDCLAAYVCWDLCGSACNDTNFRNVLAEKSSDYRVLRDLSKALKHVKLIRGQPTVRGADQMQQILVGYGEGAYGEGPYGGGEQLVVTFDDGNWRNVISLVQASRELILSELRSTAA